jgi:hypothetical protein
VTEGVVEVHTNCLDVGIFYALFLSYFVLSDYIVSAERKGNKKYKITHLLRFIEHECHILFELSCNISTKTIEQ